MAFRPLLLDLFCGVGGASVGYHDAGFDVVGVDKNPQPDYPYEFHQMDVAHISPSWIAARRFVAAHGSPPCQSQTALTKGTNKGNGVVYPNLIPQTRALFATLGIPTVIENVQGSEVRRDLTLCGEMFGLDVIRHRYFECSFPVSIPAHVKHRGRVKGYRHGVNYDGVYWSVYGDGGGKGSVPEWQQAMGIDWTSVRKSIAEAIPPAYANYVGEQILKVI